MRKLKRIPLLTRITDRIELLAASVGLAAADLYIVAAIFVMIVVTFAVLT